MLLLLHVPAFKAGDGSKYSLLTPRARVKFAANVQDISGLFKHDIGMTSDYVSISLPTESTWDTASTAAKQESWNDEL